MPHTLVTAEMRAKSKMQRRFATKGEERLWYELRDLKSAGLKFRRQAPIGPYIADFVCFDPKVVVEVDGDHHETEAGRKHDANRDAYFASSGFLVLRYDAPDVLDNAWHVAQDVKSKAGALPKLPHPRPAAGPSPQGGGRLGALPKLPHPRPAAGPSPQGGGERPSTAAVAPPGSLREPPSPQGGGEPRRPALASVPRLAHRRGGNVSADRRVPEEMPIALSYAGTTHAVMMATPADLEDFALGFSLTEGIVGGPDEIEEIAVAELEACDGNAAGIDIQIRLKDAANQNFQARRRRLAGPVGCGLCGIESIEEAMRAVRPVAEAGLALTVDEIGDAVRQLAALQPLHAATGAVHAAGFYLPGSSGTSGRIVAAREDVGRHNALDKLAGGLARSGTPGSAGAVVVTSRVSVEMVQKTAAIGAPALLAVSAPTALAVRTAEAAGMTLVALVRGEEFDVFSRPDRIIGAARHVA